MPWLWLLTEPPPPLKEIALSVKVEHVWRPVGLTPWDQSYRKGREKSKSLGKFSKPGCFKSYSYISCIIQIREMHERQLLLLWTPSKQLEVGARTENRQISLFIDGCSSHYLHTQFLKKVKVIFPLQTAQTNFNHSILVLFIFFFIKRRELCSGLP